MTGARAAALKAASDIAGAGVATLKAAIATPSASSTGAASTRTPETFSWSDSAKPWARTRSSRTQQRVERRQRRGRALLARARLEQTDLRVAVEPGERGLPDRGRIGRHAAADAHLDAETRETGLHAFDIDDVRTVGHADRGGLDLRADQIAQQRPCERAQIGARDRVEAEVEALQRQPKQPCPGDLLQIAELHQRVEEAERGRVVGAGGTRDLGKGQFRPRRREGLQHAKALRERLHGVLFGRLFGHESSEYEF